MGLTCFVAVEKIGCPQPRAGPGSRVLCVAGVRSRNLGKKILLQCGAGEHVSRSGGAAAPFTELQKTGGKARRGRVVTVRQHISRHKLSYTPPSFLCSSGTFEKETRATTWRMSINFAGTQIFPSVQINVRETGVPPRAPPTLPQPTG